VKPPKDVTPSELWVAITSSPSPSEVVDYPRQGPDGAAIGKLRIRVLPMNEHDTARLRAQRWLRETRKMPKEDWGSEAVKEVVSDAIARHLLAAACMEVDAIPKAEDDTGPERYGRIFDSPEALGKLPANELAQLFNLYLLVQHRYGGIEARIETAEEVEAWIEALAEGGSEHPLARCSWEALAELCLKMAMVIDAQRSPLESSPDGGAAEAEASESSTSWPGLPPSGSYDEGPPLPEPVEPEDFTIEDAAAVEVARLKKD
jgi:hypothetical protein